MQKKCFKCQINIESERLEIIPNTSYCIKCSKKESNNNLKGFMVFNHKTAPDIVILNTSNKEAIRLADRANKRSR